MVSALVIIGLLASMTIAVAAREGSSPENGNMNSAAQSALLEECRGIEDKAAKTECIIAARAQIREQKAPGTIAGLGAMLQARLEARQEKLEEKCKTLEGKKQERCENRLEALSECGALRGKERRDCLVDAGLKAEKKGHFQQQG